VSRKTKKEKVLSDLRRKIAALEEVSMDRKLNGGETSLSVHPPESFTHKSQVFTLNKTFVNSSQEESPVSTSSLKLHDYTYVFSDLRKILGITFFVLVVQFVLYLGIEKHSFNFLSKLIR
jgi:hypothetical protein